MSKQSRSRSPAAASAPPTALAEELQGYIRARVPVLYLVTWEEGRALREVESAAVQLRAMCLVWTETEGLRNVALSQEPEDRRAREPAAVLARIQRDTKPAVYVLVDFHPYLEQPAIRRRLRDLAHSLVASNKTIVILGPRLVLPFELQKELKVIDVPLPSREELDQHLDAIHARLEEKREVPVRLDRRQRDELIRSAQGMTLQEFEQALALAVVRTRAIDPEVIPCVLKEKEQIVRKSSALECVSWQRGFEAVGGLDQLKAWLHARKDAFSAEARNFGLPAPRGLCLIGVQGCGKSLSAKAVAQFYRVPLLRLDVGRLFAGIVGRSEENVRNALRLAESIAPCVLWVDELEKSLSGTQSSNVSDGGTTARVISTITTWLQEREGEGVYVVATANDISRLPPELLRKGRFDEIFYVDLPAPTEREEILAIHLRQRDRDPQDFELPRIAAATDGFSGAELEEVVIAGLYEAFGERRPLATEDLLTAVEQTVPLSTTMHEQVAGLRAWAAGRARRASSAGGAQA